MGKKSFSLLEILVVIVIISILISFTVPASLRYLHKVRVKECQLMVHRINSAIKSYINDYHAYFLRNQYDLFSENPYETSAFPTRVTDDDFILGPYIENNLEKRAFTRSFLDWKNHPDGGLKLVSFGLLINDQFLPLRAAQSSTSASKRVKNTARDHYRTLKQNDPSHSQQATQNAKTDFAAKKVLFRADKAISESLNSEHETTLSELAIVNGINDDFIERERIFDNEPDQMPAQVSLFQKLTSRNIYKRNYLSNVEFQKGEILTPWGDKYFIAINYINANTNTNGNNTIKFSALVVPNESARDILISKYGQSIQKDFFVYAIIPNPYDSNDIIISSLEKNFD